MDNKDIEFQKRILSTFRIEAEEHIHTFTTNLIELEKTTSTKKMAEIIEVMFREVHSLKGAARSIDQKDVESICLPLESIFSALKRHEIELSPLWFDLFYKTAEWLSKLIENLGVEQTIAFRQTQQRKIQRLKLMASGKMTTENTKEPSPKESSSTQTIQPESIPESYPQIDVQALRPTNFGMVRIPVSKLDPLLMQAEEMIQSKIAVDQRTEELRDLCFELHEWKAETQKWKNRKSSATVELWNEWLEDTEIHLNKAEHQIEQITRSMERNQHSLARIVNNQLEGMKQILMLPVSSLVETFPGMVREISKEQKKEIDFVITGNDLEIDKRILEELKDPLIHLIRNSIDHGIGKPEERLQQNKPERGKISLAFAAKESGQVEITISDDGKGINTEQLLNSALKSGIISKEKTERMGQKEVLNLIYQSGVSTSSIITDISGHGLGLPIVQEKVLKLNGKISVKSEPNNGTTFRILVPMTLATFSGILLTAKGFMFILPTMSVQRVIKVKTEDIKTIENQETIRVDNQIISVADLGEVLGLAETKHPGFTKSNHTLIVVLASGESRFSFKVDEVTGEQEVLVKGMGKLLTRVRNISGATILGSGKIVPVLNVNDLLKSALKVKSKKNEKIEVEASVPKTGKILVAEDSITSRTLLKSILKSVGYQVITSVDGADAFAKARAGDFDLIVSDVDMPNMNGFELTTKIKTDKKLSRIPVVLITALESSEDREQGLKAGADAYIIKSSFEQGDLLKVIKRLI